MIRLLNFVPWVAAPMVVITWAEITFPLWKEIPPIALILLALGLLGFTSLKAAPHLPRNTAGFFRAICFACGMTLALWRYFDA